VYYKWQRSTDGGLSWLDVTAPSGPAVPFWNGTAWEYVTSYTIPPAFTLLTNNGDKYRLVVATTLANLSDINCRFTDNMNIITINVIDCNNILATDLLSFSGKIVNTRASIKWITSAENELLIFNLEKSNDGINFKPIASLNSYNEPNASLNTYYYTDPVPLTENTFYRLNMKNNSGKAGYSKVLVLTPLFTDRDYISVINPFISELLFDISTASPGKAVTELIDINGNTVRTKAFEFAPGINRCKIENIEMLNSGIYFLITKLSSGKILQKKVIKQFH
jgi:hypothetical protein